MTLLLGPDKEMHVDRTKGMLRRTMRNGELESSLVDLILRSTTFLLVCAAAMGCSSNSRRPSPDAPHDGEFGNDVSGALESGGRDGTSTDVVVITGGAPGVDATSLTGGSQATGGAASTGGVFATGGAPGTGGATGGVTASSGLTSTGGLARNGGTTASGGSGSGGATATGGVTAYGGLTSTGGVAGNGGAMASGGSGGGGVSATGGTTATSGAMAGTLTDGGSSPDGPGVSDLATEGAVATRDGSLALPEVGQEVGVDGSGCGSTPITTQSLLGEMFDLSRLAERSRDPFAMFSSTSYDRQSVEYQSSSTDGWSGWYANHDWGNYSATESYSDGHVEYVMLNVAGPGAVVRIWTATPSGKFRVYLDDMQNPVLEADVAALLGGSIEPFTPPFGTITATGYNLEFPFAFRQWAKVTFEGNGPAFFYQVWYRAYEGCADVRTYSRSDLDSSTLDTVRSHLANPSPPPGVSSVSASLDETTADMNIAAPDGGGEISQLTVEPVLLDDASLRSSVLVIEFDDRETVRAPLGDFFGAGPGVLPHHSLPTEVTSPGQFISRFPMPFQQRAKISLIASPGQAINLTALTRARPFAPTTQYFATQWTARTAIPTAPYRDLPVARVSGEGAYVGTLLSVKNNSDVWWGEGDEKIWIDSGAFPSAFGTGTEDYFGFAYCDRHTFDSPYRMQSLATPPPEAGGNYRGLVSATRYHIMDVLRFSTALDFELELWHWDAAGTITFDTLAFLYLAQNATNLMSPPTSGDFRLPQ